MRQFHARTIGLFVVGAVTLAVAGLLAFGSMSYFEHRPRAVTFFHGSVAGLSVGAPVTFRGVRVGAVVDIAVQIDPGNGAAQIPVIMEFEPERVSVSGNGGTTDLSFAKKMMANGLGAALVMQSLITGQLSVELDYHPASEEKLSGTNLQLPEIPEATGGLNAMKDTISKLPLRELADDAVGALRELKDLLASTEVRDIVKYAAETAKSAAAIAATVEREAGGMAKDVHETTDAAHRAAERLDTMLAELQPKLLTVVAGLERLLASSDQRTGQLTADLHATLGDIHALVAPRSAPLQDVQTLLHNLAAAAGSLRSFADQVDRNPNSLLMGRSSR